MVAYDEFGPEKIIDVYDAKSGMRGFVVIDNTALGPGKGGIRMTPSVSVDEVSRLARAMTWKCSLAGLPFGGAKSGIIADPKTITSEKKRELVAAFARAIRVVVPGLYVAAPDMNMAEDEMRIIATTLNDRSVCTGKPKDLGGIPHELGSTGWGVFESAKIAIQQAGLDIKKVTFAVEGFGNVGLFAAQYLTEVGAKLIAASDSKGMIFNENGLDFKKLADVKKEKGSVTFYSDGKIMQSKDIISVKADVLITAAIPDLIKPEDVNKIAVKVIVEGSNIPMTAETEKTLAEKGVLIIPDFVANAGGVISSYVEFKGGTENEVFPMITKLVGDNTRQVLEHSRKENVTPREAAMAIAKSRVKAAMK